jgi:hypothetical protein
MEKREAVRDCSLAAFDVAAIIRTAIKTEAIAI